jgi:hypothetical protein
VCRVEEGYPRNRYVEGGKRKSIREKQYRQAEAVSTEISTGDNKVEREREDSKGRPEGSREGDRSFL